VRRNNTDDIENYENNINLVKQEGDENNDDNIFIKEESSEETFLTINNINTVQAMNAIQMNVNLKTWEEISESSQIIPTTSGLSPQ